MWDLADHNQKQQLQCLVFPDGMYYNRKKDACRTERVNTVFICISEMAGILHKNKSGNNSSKTIIPALVVRAVPTGLYLIILKYAHTSRH